MAKNVPMAKYLGSKLEIQLLRRAKVRAITYGQVTAIIDGKRVKGQEKDIAEVQNYHDALEYALTAKEIIAQFIHSETSIMANARELNRLDPFLEFVAVCFADSAKMVSTNR